MSELMTDTATALEANSLQLDLNDVDLNTLSSLKGSALGAIIEELREESQDATQARHSSHSSYSSHGTAAW